MPVHRPKTPRAVILKQLKCGRAPLAVLALVGHSLESVRWVADGTPATWPVEGPSDHGGALRGGLSLLPHGKSDFDVTLGSRGDAFYKQAQGIDLPPSSPRLRQRTDARAAEMFDFLAPTMEALLGSQQADDGVLPCGWPVLAPNAFANQRCRGGAPGR